MLRITLLACLLSFTVKAEEVKRIAYGFIKAESVKEKELSKRESLFTFQLKGIDASVRYSKIKYSIDGAEKSIKLDNGSFDVKTVPGKHIFQIYINENYFELYSDSLAITGGYHDTYDVYTHQSKIDVIMDKPVIYLYPQERTSIDVELNVNGHLTFTYPEYKNGWHLIADSDGTIIHDGNDYNYLFWEGEKKIERSSIDTKNGYIVRKEGVVDFLEKRLDEAGFTSKEKADFITYWGPRMIQNELMFVQFDQNEECKKFATLSIKPTPEHINQFYMTWFAIDEPFKTGPQILKPIDRDGFSVLEWGGQELKY